MKKSIACLLLIVYTALLSYYTLYPLVLPYIVTISPGQVWVHDSKDPFKRPTTRIVVAVKGDYVQYKYRGSEMVFSMNKRSFLTNQRKVK